MHLVIGGAVTLVLAAVIAIITLAPMPSGGPAGADKIYHGLAFASLAFPLTFVRPSVGGWVMLGVIIYGGAIELVQPYFGRQAEWADLAADGIGAVCGVIAARKARHWVKKPGHDEETKGGAKLVR